MPQISVGYGRTGLSTLRWLGEINEFPLILGREFSGIVKEKGPNVRDDIQIGDKVWGLVPLQQPGAHAEYVVVDQSTVSHKKINKHAFNLLFSDFNRKLTVEIYKIQITQKPDNIDDTGAAGMLFVGLTVWSSCAKHDCTKSIGYG